MSKAMLVMDMPKSCRECSLAENRSIQLEESYICSPKRKWVTDKECENRQNWCPLKEVPKKQPHYSVDETFMRGAKTGYNACIDDILKGSVENE